MSDLESCVFCQLISTDQAQWVAKTADAVAFLPLPEGSLAPGHVLVVPRRHCVGVQDADPADLNAAIDLVQRVSQAMSSALGAPGVVVLNASGPESGQSVGHLHFHVVPCWPNDDATFWPNEKSAHTVDADPQELLAAVLA